MFRSSKYIRDKSVVVVKFDDSYFVSDFKDSIIFFRVLFLIISFAVDTISGIYLDYDSNSYSGYVLFAEWLTSRLHIRKEVNGKYVCIICTYCYK